jgi:enoyl-CoA hydratase/carnithine racemase
VTTVTLNRPEVRNAFNDEVIAELTAVFLNWASATRCAASCWPATARPSAPAPT